MSTVTARTDAKLKRAKHHEIAVRYGHGRKPASMAAWRIAELNREFSDRWGGTLLPDDDAGRDDIELMLHHLARRAGDPARHIAGWLDLRAPWFAGIERATMVERVLANPLKFKADTVAKRIGLTAERRARLKIRTIGAIDQTATERKAARKAQKSKAMRAVRRKNGIKPRVDYLAQSTEKAKPWLVEGVSRRTWYRRRRTPFGTAAALY
jgi:hypothetical protein